MMITPEQLLAYERQLNEGDSDLEATKPDDPYYCVKCDSDRIYSYDDDYLVCPKCGEVFIFQEDMLAINRNPRHIYKRMTYLNDLLNNLTGTEHYAIPHWIQKSVKKYLKENNIEYNNLTIGQMKTILKKLSKNETEPERIKEIKACYKHSPYFISLLIGRPYIELSCSLRAKIQYLFIDFEREYKKSKEKYMINYNQLLKKCFEILGVQDLANKIPIPIVVSRLNRNKDIINSIFEKFCKK
jgi:DNA-directed RNA polymerase subunit RPC12/RpoP